MIAKGHDFPNVTLSAVVLADIGLSLPTYRASERTFQLIAQAVGRSGRSKRVGEAMIQTYNPDHYAIKNGASQDYGAFYLREMQQRRITEYPPYWNCILLEFSSSKEEKAVESSMDFKKEILGLGIENLNVLGPITPFYSMNNGKHKRVLLLKFKKRESIDSYLRQLLQRFSSLAGVDISVNVDPLDY
jgi:primosomal protein N' (replication factor Y)